MRSSRFVFQFCLFRMTLQYFNNRDVADRDKTYENHHHHHHHHHANARDSLPRGRGRGGGEEGRGEGVVGRAVAASKKKPNLQAHKCEKHEDETMRIIFIKKDKLNKRQQFYFSNIYKSFCSKTGLRF